MVFVTNVLMLVNALTTSKYLFNRLGDACTHCYYCIQSGVEQPMCWSGSLDSY